MKNKLLGEGIVEGANSKGGGGGGGGLLTFFPEKEGGLIRGRGLIWEEGLIDDIASYPWLMLHKTVADLTWVQNSKWQKSSHLCKDKIAY